jgi:hypothetical protein
MTRCNRIDPWGDLHVDPARGLFTGNRGPLVDDDRRIVRHHASSTLWITCVLRFRDWRHPLDQPHIWTPLFFLDDAVALAAGHRPCAFCRRPDYRAYRDAVSDGSRPLKAMEIDRRLASERLRRGRGFSRAKDRPLWTADLAALPVGTVVVHGSHGPCLVGRAALQPFTFAGWGAPFPRPGGDATVLTPPTSVAALRGGFTPTMHPSAVT